MVESIRREYSLAVLLGGLCLLFGFILALEWTKISMDIRESKQRLDKPINSTLQLDELPEDDFALSSIDNYAEMVAAPLTVNGRRPLNMNTEDNSSFVDDPMETDLNAKLMGIYSTPDGMIALFVDAKGDYSRIKENEQMQGWVLEKLYEDRATLTQAGQSQELLLRKPKPKVMARQPQTKTRKTPTIRRNQPKTSG